MLSHPHEALAAGGGHAGGEILHRGRALALSSNLKHQSNAQNVVDGPGRGCAMSPQYNNLDYFCESQSQWFLSG